MSTSKYFKLYFKILITSSKKKKNNRVETIFENMVPFKILTLGFDFKFELVCHNDLKSQSEEPMSVL